MEWSESNSNSAVITSLGQLEILCTHLWQQCRYLYSLCALLYFSVYSVLANYVCTILSLTLASYIYTDAAIELCLLFHCLSPGISDVSGLGGGGGEGDEMGEEELERDGE